ncbi:hypothetical protein CBL_08650 [Carabus blaptoides fortunei]
MVCFSALSTKETISTNKCIAHMETHFLTNQSVARYFQNARVPGIKWSASRKATVHCWVHTMSGVPRSATLSKRTTDVVASWSHRWRQRAKKKTSRRTKGLIVPIVSK